MEVKIFVIPEVQIEGKILIKFEVQIYICVKSEVQILVTFEVLNYI